MTDSLVYDAAAVTAVIGYTDRVTQLHPLLRRFGVVVSCLLGVIYYISIRPSRHELGRNIASGVMIGLAASGGFAGMKSMVEKPTT